MIFFITNHIGVLKEKKIKRFPVTVLHTILQQSFHVTTTTQVVSVTGMFDSACMSMSDESRLWPVQLWGVFTDLWRRCEAVVPRLQQPRAGQRRPLLYRPTRQVPHLQQQGLSCRHCRLQVPAHLENYQFILNYTFWFTVLQQVCLILCLSFSSSKPYVILIPLIFEIT